jgi:hypothetical protein
MATLIIRPDGDGATHNLTCSSGSTHYALVDEAVADDADYVSYTLPGGSSGSDVDYYSFPNPSLSGVINSVKIYARAQRTGAGNGAYIYLYIKDATTESGVTQADLTASWASYTATYTTKPSGGAWTWSAISAMQARLGLGVAQGIGGTYVAYCSQLYVEVDYTPPVYFDSIECLGMSNGYANVRGVLKAGVSAVGYKRAQIDHEDTFASPLADTTEIAAAGETEGTINLVATWTPSSAGTYYARLGVRASEEAILVWVTAAFIVQFPSIISVIPSQKQEHCTVTMTVSDDYVDPPEVTVFVDGRSYVAHL